MRLRFYTSLGAATGASTALALTPTSEPAPIGLMVVLGLLGVAVGGLVALLRSALDAQDRRNRQATSSQIARMFADREEVARRTK